ncbi:MAG: DedA family protein [Candidatus Adlerbacteria bacterium]|nr:DedA family protein [Candidatus Adlerbacteria bacterium]
MHLLEHITERGERSWAWFSQRAHSQHAKMWLAILSFLEPIISPIVPETLMVAMLLAGSNDRRWKAYAALTTAFSFLGGLVGYGIGMLAFYYFGEGLLAYFGLGDLHAQAQFLLGGSIFVVMFFVTFTPLPDKVFTILSGFFGVPLLPYAVGFLAGRALRFTLVAYMVHRMGPRILDVLNRYFLWVAVAVLVLGIIYGMVRFNVLGL